MADFEDPVTDIEVWDGKRLRVMIVWDVEAEIVHLRMDSNQMIPSLGLMERAKMMLTKKEILASTKGTPMEGHKIVRFPGPAGMQ